MGMSPIVDLPIYILISNMRNILFFHWTMHLWEKKSRRWIAHEFSGEKPFSVSVWDVWSIQVLTEALEHPETPQALKEAKGSDFFPVRNCVDVWDIFLRGCKTSNRGATYLFGEGLFNWLICLMDIATGGMWSHHGVRFQTSGGPQFLIHTFHQISIIILKLWNASKVEIIWSNTKTGHFRNEEACVWGGRLHPTYIAIVAFTFGVCKGHPFFPHFS